LLVAGFGALVAGDVGGAVGGGGDEAWVLLEDAAARCLENTMGLRLTVVLVKSEPAGSWHDLACGLVIPVRVGAGVGLAGGDDAAHVAVGRSGGEEGQSRYGCSDRHGSVLRVGEHIDGKGFG